MKITDFNIKAEPTQCCELLRQYEAHEDQGGTLREFLLLFDYASEAELRRAVWTIMDRAANDDYYCNNEKHLPSRSASIHARYKKLDRDASKREIFPESIAQELWNGGYSRKKLDENTQRLFSMQPDRDAFNMTSEWVKAEYGLTDNDMKKLHFFVEQVKAGREFPNSLRRMLYLWGDKKKTGKTTSASCIVEILNAYTGPYKNAQGFTTILSNELQVGGFKVPLIASCNVALMDECFFADMGKMYADFKRFITSSDGRARLPYGQEFEWHGLPNYVSTSNDPLQKFIKDWGDRRYLAIEFKNKPTQEIGDFQTIKDMWMLYIVNSQREKEWTDWSREIETIADETGERTERANEFAQELRQTPFLDWICNKQADYDINGQNNRITLKVFRDYFREVGGHDMSKLGGEIEKAVLDVFGPRYSSTNYWRLPELQKRAQDIKMARIEEEDSEEEDNEPTNLPF